MLLTFSLLISDVINEVNQQLAYQNILVKQTQIDKLNLDPEEKSKKKAVIEAIGKSAIIDVKKSTVSTAICHILYKHRTQHVPDTPTTGDSDQPRSDVAEDTTSIQEEVNGPASSSEDGPPAKKARQQPASDL